MTVAAVLSSLTCSQRYVSVLPVSLALRATVPLRVTVVALEAAAVPVLSATASWSLPALTIGSGTGGSLGAMETKALTALSCSTTFPPSRARAEKSSWAEKVSVVISLTASSWMGMTTVALRAVSPRVMAWLTRRVKSPGAAALRSRVLTTRRKSPLVMGTSAAGLRMTAVSVTAPAPSRVVSVRENGAQPARMMSLSRMVTVAESGATVTLSTPAVCAVARLTRKVSSVSGLASSVSATVKHRRRLSSLSVATVRRLMAV